MEAKASDEQDQGISSGSNESSNISSENGSSSTEDSSAFANVPELDAMIQTTHEVFLKYALYTPDILAEIPKKQAEYKVTKIPH